MDSKDTRKMMSSNNKVWYVYMPNRSKTTYRLQLKLFPEHLEQNQQRRSRIIAGHTREDLYIATVPDT
jgi:hypothetical protein